MSRWHSSNNAFAANIFRLLAGFHFGSRAIRSRYLHSLLILWAIPLSNSMAARRQMSAWCASSDTVSARPGAVRFRGPALFRD
jgi:hypothetical protein